MATAEELLNAALVDPTTEPHIVVDANRMITVPEQLKRIAVQYDHNAETVTFDCPRYWDGTDMSDMVIYINYFTPDGRVGCYPAKNVAVDENDSTIMHFDWTITRNVTLKDGNVSFLVCVNTVDDEGNEEYHWNSEMYNGMIVSKGLECNQIIVEEYPDVITDILEKMRELEVGGVVCDETLTLEDYPAEAKAVGDKFRLVDDALTEVDNKFSTIDEALEKADEKLEEVEGNFAKSIEDLPITVTEDGDKKYTDIEGLRKVTNIDVVREEQTITITTTLQGDKFHIDTIDLDEYDRPISGTSDGVAWEMSWEGFDI
jgi:hypothetical protein